MSRNSQKKRSIVFFLIPQFTMLPFAAAVETLRIANRMLGYQAYEWRLASLDGQKVMSSSGIWFVRRARVPVFGSMML